MVHRFALSLLCWLFLSWQAQAAICFWVGGTGTWTHTDGTKWASATGGSASTCAATGGVPDNTGDQPTFDANSGGGTATVNDASITAGILVLTNYTGTLDFSANNNNVSFTGFSDTAGTHTLNMGSGVWTVTSSAVTVWNSNNAGLTLNAGTSTLNFTGTSNGVNQAFNLGGKTYSTVSFASGGASLGFMNLGSSNTFGHLNVTAPVAISVTAATTQTVSGTFNWAGSFSKNVFFTSGTAGSAATVSAQASGNTCNFCAFRDMTFNTNVPIGTTCWDLGHNSGITCNAP